MYSSLILISFMTMTSIFRFTDSVKYTEVKMRETDLTGDFFQDVDATSLGVHTCLNMLELKICNSVCARDIDCAEADHSMTCGEQCIFNCAFLEHFKDRKCVNRMIANLDWYRHFGGATGYKSKIKPGARGAPGAKGAPSAEGAPGAPVATNTPGASSTTIKTTPTS